MSYFITLVVCEQLQSIRVPALPVSVKGRLYTRHVTRGRAQEAGPRVWKPDGDGATAVCCAAGTGTARALLAVTAVRESRPFLQGAAASPGAHGGSPNLLLPCTCGLDLQLPASSQMEGIECGLSPQKTCPHPDRQNL